MSIYLLKITYLISIFYFTINITVERNKYPIKIENPYPTRSNKKNSYVKLEVNEKNNIRKKTILDLKYHAIKKNANKENIVEIILNQEGKIVGYKPCVVFYPNYFTKTQPKSIIETSKKFKKNKINLCLIKLKFKSTKIDF